MSFRALRPYLLAVLLTVPGLALRFAHPDISPLWVALLSGLAILGASFLLTWACEVAQMDIPQAVAVAVVAVAAFSLQPGWIVAAWTLAAVPAGVLALSYRALFSLCRRRALTPPTRS